MPILLFLLLLPAFTLNASHPTPDEAKASQQRAAWDSWDDLNDVIEKLRYKMRWFIKDPYSLQSWHWEPCEIIRTVGGKRISQNGHQLVVTHGGITDHYRDIWAASLEKVLKSPHLESMKKFLAMEAILKQPDLTDEQKVDYFTEELKRTGLLEWLEELD